MFGIVTQEVFESRRVVRHHVIDHVTPLGNAIKRHVEKRRFKEKVERFLLPSSPCLLKATDA